MARVPLRAWGQQLRLLILAQGPSELRACAIHKGQEHLRCPPHSCPHSLILPQQPQGLSQNKKPIKSRRDLLTPFPLDLDKQESFPEPTKLYSPVSTSSLCFSLHFPPFHSLSLLHVLPSFWLLSFGDKLLLYLEPRLGTVLIYL